MKMFINILIVAAISLAFMRQEACAAAPRVEIGEKAAVCNIRRGSGVGTVVGSVTFTQESPDECVRIEIRLTGLDPAVSKLIGFHVHENKSLANQCAGAGAHLNILQVQHGSPNDPKAARHTGDLGNLKVSAAGSVFAVTTERLFTLYNANNNQVNILDRSCVVHENQDDIGIGGAATSLTTGNSGRRLGCCIIETTAYRKPSD